MRKSCWCGRIQSCPAHSQPSGNGTGWSPWRDSTKQARFRTVVLARAGCRCQATDPDGERCTVTGPKQLEAHHDGEPGTYNPEEGRALCKPHNNEESAAMRAMGPSR